MKDSISELRTAIRRLRPFLLLSKETSSVSSAQHHCLPTTTSPAAAASSGIKFATAAPTVAADAVTTTSAANTHATSSSLPEVGATGCEEEVHENDVLRHELQEESITELVESLASFVYDLDLFWAAAGNVEEHDEKDEVEVVSENDEGGGSTSPTRKQVVAAGRRQRSTAITNSANRQGHSEPESEWNEEAKLLVREGYGLLLAATATPTTKNHCPRYPHQQQYPRGLVQNCDDENVSMRCVVLNSILDLLPSLNTSPCRHFLLSFLPHFMPSASSSSSSFSWSDNKEDIMDGRGSSWKHVPTWLHEDDNDIFGIAVVDTNEISMSKAFHHQQDQQSRSNSIAKEDNDGVVVSGSQNNNLLLVSKLLEVFQALIQTDVSTLAPLLAIVSTLFIKFNNSMKNNNEDDDDDDVSQPRDRSQGSGPTSSNLARIECFHLCLSSMSSVSEHDLPSLLNSLLALVWTVEEGRLVMDTVRREWMSICSASNDDDVAVVIEEQTVGRDDEKLAVEYTRHNPHVDHSLEYIGDVIIQFMLSVQTPGSRNVAQGFLNSLDSSLHHTATKDGTDTQAKLSSTPLTSLDVILMIALYSHHEYQHMVESIMDSMPHHQTIALFELVYPLIQSWTPSGVRSRRQKNDNERTDSILYEPLASPLISILFYIMMVSSSSPSSCSSSLMGGILPFCSACVPFSTTRNDDEGLCTAAISSSACCRVLAKLYLTVDPNRQETIINSLLSMITDSFVFSASLDFARKNHRRRYQQCEQSSSSTLRRMAQTRHDMLLEAARAACRTLLIISKGNGSNTSNIRGTVLDRLLLLASKSVLKTSFTEKLNADNDATTYYHLFDMNCALGISLLQSSDEDEESNLSHADSNESSELLILCQKLLFSSNFVSTATSTSSNSYQHRAVCGMILASRLLRCKLIPNSDRGNIWSWIITVISPSSSAAKPLDALDPEVARWGLTLLQFASSVIPTENSPSIDAIYNCRTNFPEMDRFVETQPVCGQGDVFNQVNKMLATAGIIQWEDSLKVPLFLTESRNPTPHTFLAFTDVSMYDQLSKQKSPTARSMVICGPHFLHGRLSQLEWLHPSNANHDKSFHASIDLVSDYVYHLIDRYLGLGTLKSANWNPRGWLLAKTQLPCCLTESTMEILGMRGHYSLELSDQSQGLADDDISHRGVKADDFQKQWRHLFADETRAKVTVIRHLVEFVNSVIISISVSSAALKHAYQHFQQNEMCISSQSTLDSNSHENKSMQRRKRKQVEALRKLLQFQVSKILTMREICKDINLALRGLANSVQQTNRARIHPKNSITNDSSTEETVRDTSRQCVEKVGLSFSLFSTLHLPSTISHSTSCFMLLLAGNPRKKTDSLV
jgi:hypothetical protein